MLTVSSILALLLAAGQEDARILSTGNLGARHDALARIIAVTPAERTPDLWRALRQEVDRVVACLDVRSPSPAERQTLHCDMTPRSEDDYLENLVGALSQSRDPSMIPTLTRLTWQSQIPIITLVLATKDVTLRTEVEALARDASAWRQRGLTDQSRITQVQNSIRAALARHPTL